MKKFLIIGVVIFLVGASVAGIIAYRMYNKPHRDIAREEPAFTMTEEELARMFSDDAAASELKLKNKVIQFSGSLKTVEQSGGVKNLTFDLGGSYMISAALDSTETKTPKAGDALTVKGLYVGAIEGDADFGIPGEIKIKNGFIQ